MTTRVTKLIAVATIAVVAFMMPTVARAESKVVASGAKPVSWTDDGCYIHVHRKTKRRPQAELHVSCSIITGSPGDGAIIKYRFPEWGVPTSFGALIEEDGHGALGDLPYVHAWQDLEHPRIGYVHVPGPSEEKPRGIYVHVMSVVWNGKLHDAVREVNYEPYG